MSRVQLALNVADLDEAVAFYSQLFATEPAKVRPRYANFEVADPPLKLVLIEDGSRPPGSLNHLGVEVETAEEVADSQRRLSVAGLPTVTEDHTTCCYALQDKVWIDGPAGHRWEVYTVLADADADADAADTADAAAAATTAATTAAPTPLACSCC